MGRVSSSLAGKLVRWEPEEPLEGVVGTLRLLVPEKEADLWTETEIRERTWQCACP